MRGYDAHSAGRNLTVFQSGHITTHGGTAGENASAHTDA